MQHITFEKNAPNPNRSVRHFFVPFLINSRATSKFLRVGVVNKVMAGYDDKDLLLI